MNAGLAASMGDNAEAVQGALGDALARVVQLLDQADNFRERMPAG